MIGNGVKKSIRNYSKGASRFARQISETVDVEDVLKSIHKVAHPEQHRERRRSIVHTTIGMYTSYFVLSFGES